MIAIGTKAPPFALKNQDGETVRLADYTGFWVVLYFYPEDDTTDCTTQACDFTSSIKSFERIDATVIGISPDPPDSHQAFAKKYNLRIVLLSDESKKTMAAYDAYGEKNMYGRMVTGVKRSTCIIDPSGRIAAHWKRVIARGHADAVMQKLRTLQSEFVQ